MRYYLVFYIFNFLDFYSARPLKNFYSRLSIFKKCFPRPVHGAFFNVMSIAFLKLYFCPFAFCPLLSARPRLFIFSKIL